MNASNSRRRLSFALWLVALMVAAIGPSGARADNDPAVGDSVVVSGTEGSGLILRAGPGISHRVVTVLSEGATARVIAGPVSDGDDDWYQVSVGETTGWGRAQYLRRERPSASRSPTVEALGLGNTTLLPSRAPPDGRRAFVAKITAYADGVGGVPHEATTATGTRTRWGVVAVDPKFIPLGTTLKISGYDDTIFTAEDVGGAITGNAVDIWLPDPDEAKRYGTQYRLVTILTEGKRR